MKKTTSAYSTLTFLFASLFFLSGCSSKEGTKYKESTKNTTSMASEMPLAENKIHDLKIAMNKLWEDHVVWTRNVILCLVDDLPGAVGTTSVRVIKRQIQFTISVQSVELDKGQMLTLNNNILHSVIFKK